MQITNKQHLISGAATLEIEMEQIVNEVKTMSLKELTALVIDLQAQVQALTAPKPTASGKEMTDDDARRIMTGDHAATKHKQAAEELGLSYGQIYSCRLGFTFKHIHKEMRDANVANPWMK